MQLSFPIRFAIGSLMLSTIFIAAWRSHPTHVIAPFAQKSHAAESPFAEYLYLSADGQVIDKLCRLAAGTLAFALRLKAWENYWDCLVDPLLAGYCLIAALTWLVRVAAHKVRRAHAV
ncbi:hypothetical protein [Pseudomonas huanghezhanensis]|uniref:hypothetical protein n=1 Tax=Pseudomonas huanghezhanensis TaxID=3002903 RepID=UPI0022854272|nr:hypothetical protein [Pseudomonas sp. BSw22131]